MCAENIISKECLRHVHEVSIAYPFQHSFKTVSTKSSRTPHLFPRNGTHRLDEHGRHQRRKMPRRAKHATRYVPMKERTMRIATFAVPRDEMNTRYFRAFQERCNESKRCLQYFLYRLQFPSGCWPQIHQDVLNCRSLRFYFFGRTGNDASCDHGTQRRSTPRAEASRCVARPPWHQCFPMHGPVSCYELDCRTTPLVRKFSVTPAHCMTTPDALGNSAKIMVLDAGVVWSELIHRNALVRIVSRAASACHCDRQLDRSNNKPARVNFAKQQILETMLDTFPRKRLPMIAANQERTDRGVLLVYCHIRNRI